MGIDDEDVAAVRAASDMVAVVSQYVQLRKVGMRWQGRCPFHSENTPSFSVNADEKLYYCFGCQARGDVFTFVQHQEQLDFPESVEWLAAKADITLRYTDRQQGEGRKKRARLVEVLERAVEWYHQRLLTSADAGAARSYLRGRGLDGDVVRAFRIGWAPEGWDELCRSLRLDEATARDTGLGRRNNRGRLQDHFRGRIMFPIADDQGRPISFGGRILPGGERPGNQGKYQNTTETPLYTKSRVLYGLDRAKKAMVTDDTAVICEGYTDVIGFHRAGMPLAVATCGTALTDEHVALLRRFARRFVLAFDADNAGQAAAERLYRWEREHDLEVAVADLPPGQDPADLARSDPDQLPSAVARARPFLRFRLDRAFAAAELSSPEGRARVAQDALALVAEHPDLLVRDQYVVDVAGRCRMEPDLLRGQLDEVRRARARGGRRGGPRAGSGSRPGPAGGPGGGRSGDAPAAGSARPGAGGRGAGRRAASGAEPPGGSRSEAGPGAEGPAGPGAGGAPSPVPAGAGRGAPGAVEVPNRPDELPAGYHGEAVVDPRAGGDAPTHAAGGARRAGGASPRSARAERAVGASERAGPALEVLRHAVHDPAAVGRWLTEAVFDDPAHIAVFRALVEHDTHEAALATVAPPADGLLARLLVEQPGTAPFDAVRRVLTEVARRELHVLRVVDDEDPAVLRASVELNRLMAGLGVRDEVAASDSADRLLAWLEQRVGDGG